MSEINYVLFFLNFICMFLFICARKSFPNIFFKLLYYLTSFPGFLYTLVIKLELCSKINNGSRSIFRQVTYVSAFWMYLGSKKCILNTVLNYITIISSVLIYFLLRILYHFYSTPTSVLSIFLFIVLYLYNIGSKDSQQ